ncbi:MAG TPA: hypothetical protein VGM74_05765 [Burkholderiaceae bacterium]|jgi:hypothetical protein
MNSSMDTSAGRQHTRQSADLDLSVQWNDASLGLTAQDHMAAGLSHLFESEAPQRSHGFCARDPGQLRHAGVLAR